MSTEQRISTLEEVSQLLVSALRSFNESMRRYEAAAARRDEAILLMGEAIERLQESGRETADTVARREDSMRALQAFVPLTQAEIVRLDNRIDQIEGR